MGEQWYTQSNAHSRAEVCEARQEFVRNTMSRLCFGMNVVNCMTWGFWEWHCVNHETFPSDCLTLKIKPQCLFELSETTHSVTQHHIPGDLNPQSPHRSNVIFPLGYIFHHCAFKISCLFHAPCFALKTAMLDPAYLLSSLQHTRALIRQELCLQQKGGATDGHTVFTLIAEYNTAHSLEANARIVSRKYPATSYQIPFQFIIHSSFSAIQSELSAATFREPKTT
jgi:hypothetical protein